MSPAGRMSAERIALAMRGDPQFHPPRRPKLVDGLVVLALDDGILVEGAGERQHLRGAASRTLLPELLDRLDGERDVGGLAAALAQPPARVGKAIALLYACGLLEEGAGDDVPETADGEVATFLSRLVDSTRANASAAGALDRLATAVVGVTGPLAAAEALAAELRRAGVGTAAPAAMLAAGAPVTLAVGIEDGRADLARLDRDCASAGVPWVRFARCDDAIEIGPRFERSVSLCYACFAALHRAHRPVAPDGDPVAHDLLIAHAAADVTWLIARTCTALSASGVTRIALDDLAGERRAYPPRPGCSTCGTGAASPLAGVPVGYAYDRSVAFPPRHLLNVKDHQHHFRESNLALQGDAKDYPNAARLDLPGPADERSPAGAFAGGVAQPPGRGGQLDPPALVAQPAGRGGQLDLPALAALLARAAGVRGAGQGPPALPGKLPRWAPSGGNLGSPGVYVVVSRELPGVEAGIWFYAPRARQLLRPGPPLDPEQLAALLCAATGDALHPQTQVALVLTGALVRVAQKYGTFAYRTVHLDAGCALGQLHVTAAGLGLALESASSWDDDALLDALGVGEFEPITAVVGVRPGAGGLRPAGTAARPCAAPGAGGLRRAGTAARPSAAPAGDAGLLGGSEFEPTRIYRELLPRSRLAFQAPARQPAATRAPWRREAAAAPVSLEHAPGGDAIDAVLRRRRSVRAYDPRPLDGTSVGTALRAAGHAPIDAACRDAIEVAVLSRRVDGLEQGLWSLDGVDPVRLVRRNDLPSEEAAEDIVLQREYAHAPVLILVLGSLRTMEERAGAHGYRLLLRAATAVAHAAWLGALSVGVDGSIFAGLLPDAIDRLCGGGPYDRAQLIGLALGCAPAAD